MPPSLLQHIRDRVAGETGPEFAPSNRRMAMIYPSPYRAGMSSLGYQWITTLLRDRGIGAERAFLPDDPAAYRACLGIDVGDGTVKFLGTVAEPWQRADFAKIDAASLWLTGRADEPAETRFWLERPRGHSKTADLAAVVVWLLAFSPRPLTGIAAAGDWFAGR